MLFHTPRPRSGDGERPTPPEPSGALDGLPLAALAFDQAPVALAVTALDGRCLRVNQALCDLLGYPAEELLGTTYRTVTHPDDVHLDQEAMAVLAAGDGRGPAIEKRYRRADGHVAWARVTGTVMRDGTGQPVAVVVAAEDIGEHRSRHAELARLALHDPLTGVGNRALLDRDIDRTLRTRDREGGVVVVLYLDVDDFKGINDVHGHDAGDRMLVVIGSRLRDALREQDTVARVGGDEFVLVAHLPAADDARDLRDRVRRVCREPVAVGAGTLSGHVSVGMTVVDRPGCTTAQALAAADAAMYRVKRDRWGVGAPGA